MPIGDRSIPFGPRPASSASEVKRDALRTLVRRQHYPNVGPAAKAGNGFYTATLVHLLLCRKGDVSSAWMPGRAADVTPFKGSLKSSLVVVGTMASAAEFCLTSFSGAPVAAPQYNGHRARMATRVNEPDKRNLSVFQ